MSNVSGCTSTAKREANYSADEAACTASPEQLAAREELGRQDADRAAEQRRDAYLASGTHVGGETSAKGTSRLAGPNQTPDNPALRASLRTKAIDHPLQDDPLGNAIVGILAGGVANGIRAAALHGGTPMAHIPHALAHEAAEHVVLHGVPHHVKHAVESSVDVTTLVGPTAPQPQGLETPASAGRASARGASEVAPAPNRSEGAPAPLSPPGPVAPHLLDAQGPVTPAVMSIRG